MKYLGKVSPFARKTPIFECNHNMLYYSKFGNVLYYMCNNK